MILESDKIADTDGTVLENDIAVMWVRKEAEVIVEVGTRMEADLERVIGIDGESWITIKMEADEDSKGWNLKKHFFQPYCT